MSRYSQALKDLCNQLVVDGRRQLDMNMGIVSHIHQDRYEIVAVSSDNNVFVAGEDFALKDTYCREVCEKQQTVALTAIDNLPGLQKHPLYEALPLEQYISAPIIVNDKVWGTLNFSAMILREQPFTDAEIDWVESGAKAIADLLTVEY